MLTPTPDSGPHLAIHIAQASLLGTAPAYFKYLLERGQDTCLAKILGVYQVAAALAQMKSAAMRSRSARGGCLMACCR